MISLDGKTHRAATVSRRDVAADLSCMNFQSVNISVVCGTIKNTYNFHIKILNGFWNNFIIVSYGSPSRNYGGDASEYQTWRQVYRLYIIIDIDRSFKLWAIKEIEQIVIVR